MLGELTTLPDPLAGFGWDQYYRTPRNKELLVGYSRSRYSVYESLTFETFENEGSVAMQKKIKP